MNSNLLRVALCLLLVSCFITGCAGRDVEIGHDIKIDEAVWFYFPAVDHTTNGVSEEKYKTLPAYWDEAKVSRLLLEGAGWLTPEGTSITPGTVRITRSRHEWGGEVSTSADGYLVEASCVLSVKRDAKPGPRSIELYMPAIPAFSAALDAVPMVPDDVDFSGHTFHGTDRLNVKTVTIHETSSGVTWAIVWKSLLVIVIILLVLRFAGT